MSDRKADRGRRILGGIIDRVQNLEYTGIHMGIIRGVKDYSRSGALKVYIPYLGATPNKTDEIDPNTGLAPGEVVEARAAAPPRGRSQRRRPR